MEKELIELTKIFKENNFSELDCVVNEEKMLYLYAFYHYGYGDVDYIFDICNGCAYTKQFNNMAQGFFESEETGEPELHIISTLWLNPDEEFSVDNAIDNLLTVEQMIRDISKGYYSLTANKSKLKDMWDSNSDMHLRVRLVTNAIVDNVEKKNEIKEKVADSSRLDFVSFDIYFGDDILQDIQDTVAPKDKVLSSFVVMDSPNNYLVYGDEKSIIVNVKASSIKENYCRYGRAGLFAQNLRFYVKNAKVDDGIKQSIQEKGEKFWYLNNGIIIICDDYRIEGERIYLTNFSIVNGGQTTRMIGETSFVNDFVITCKIIKNKYDSDFERVSFVSEIAEASNTQKPIKSTDLVANKPEQRLLKKQLEDANIFCQIKRGDIPTNSKMNYPEPWQKTKNDEVAQLLFSAVYQKPGYSRNSKDKLTSVDHNYNTIFKKQYSVDFIKDLLIIRSVYKKWVKHTIDHSNDPMKVGLAKNGQFYMVAIIGLMAKFFYSPDLAQAVVEATADETKKKYLISQPVLSHRIFGVDFADISKPLFKLFDLICERYYQKVYATIKTFKQDLAYSNFTKTDMYYTTHVLSYIKDDFTNGVSGVILPLLNELFYKENENEKVETGKTVEKIINGYEINKDEEETEEDPIADNLRASLTDFRTETYKKKGIKPYEVFTNAERELIVKFKPKTIKDVKNCFQSKPKTKTGLYGEDILSIVKSICYKE